MSNQVGRNEIKDKAVNFNKLDVNLQNQINNLENKVNGLGTEILQTNNKTIREAINELFQYGVNLQTTAKSALDAAGISYTDTQLSTLVNTMANNLGGGVTGTITYDSDGVYGNISDDMKTFVIPLRYILSFCTLALTSDKSAPDKAILNRYNISESNNIITGKFILYTKLNYKISGTTSGRYFMDYYDGTIKISYDKNNTIFNFINGNFYTWEYDTFIGSQNIEYDDTTIKLVTNKNNLKCNGNVRLNYVAFLNL